MHKSTADMHSVARTLCRGRTSLIQRLSSNPLVNPCSLRGRVQPFFIKPFFSKPSVRCNSSSTWPPVLGRPYKLTGAPEIPPEWYDAEKDRLFILDVMGPLFRIDGGYGKTKLTAPSGEDTTLLFGFLKFFLGILGCQPPPTHVVMVFDAPGATFRTDISAKDLWHPDNVADFIQTRNQSFNSDTFSKAFPNKTSPKGRDELYPAYKGNRPQLNERVYTGGRKVKEWLESLGIKCLQVHGVEADDVCGTLACRAIEAGMSAFLFSLDKDFFQLLQKDLLLFRGPAKLGEFRLHTAEGFSEERKGLLPKQFIEVAGLCGDPSDNIPGVFGIGEKSAMELVLEHMDIEGVIEAAKTGMLKDSKRNKPLFMEEGWNAARKSRQLVEIQTQLKMPDVRFNIEECRLMQPADRAAFETLRELGINQPVPRLKELVAQWQQ
ncbi:hypothetical protein BSKO_08183 [Bryopsis sp. KO-2023]|nr:hypothetical protein BSKO_08183 [Bryopsis sp. KO-2023]